MSGIQNKPDTQTFTELRCNNCNKIIPEEYFNYQHEQCICCVEILENKDKQCIICKQTKNITLFERPYLRRCKKCAANWARFKKYNKQFSDKNITIWV